MAAAGMTCLFCEHRPTAGRASSVDRLRTALQRVPSLSDRERDVLQLLGLGLSDAEVAAVLCITTRTVKFHVANVVRKLGGVSRIQAGLVAVAYHERSCPNGQ